jgi:ribosome-associated translation inhibitor RaiA
LNQQDDLNASNNNSSTMQQALDNYSKKELRRVQKLKNKLKNVGPNIAPHNI